MLPFAAAPTGGLYVPGPMVRHRETGEPRAAAAPVCRARRHGARQDMVFDGYQRAHAGLPPRKPRVLLLSQDP